MDSRSYATKSTLRISTGHHIETDSVYDWKYFYLAAIPQTSPAAPYVCPPLSLTYTLTRHTHPACFENAWWPIYYWRGTPTDKQIPRNEVIWPGHVYTNTAEGFYGWCFPVSLHRFPQQFLFSPLYVPKHTVDQNTAVDAILDHRNHHTLKQTSKCEGFRVQMSLQYGKEKKKKGGGGPPDLITRWGQTR